EMRGNIGFVETAPLLAKLVDVELEEARAPPCWHPCVGRPWPSPVGSSFGPSEPVHRLARGVFAPCHLATGVTQAGHGGAPRVRAPNEPLPDLGDRRALGSLEHADQRRALGARSRS